jgi:hypothetical protein
VLNDRQIVVTGARAPAAGPAPETHAVAFEDLGALEAVGAAIVTAQREWHGS